MDEDMEGEVMEINSSSSSSSDSENEENEMETRAAELEKQVQADLYLYDVHVELTDLYRKLGDLISMRAAYERFSKAYPLTATLWLQWIHDEIKIAHHEKEKRRILDLFKKATKDYQSSKLWLEYCQYAIANCPITEVKEIFQLAVNIVGIDVSEGSLIWDMYREFEMAHLSLAEPESPAFEEQLKKVIDLYHRQLRVPLLGMEKTMKEYKSFVEQLPNDLDIDTKQIEWAYNKALKAVEKYKSFEDDLAKCSDDEAYDIFTNYIKAIDDRILIICTYERAVARLPLNVDLWMAYCQFAPQLGRVAVEVCEKAVRNCSWVADLWCWRLKVMEVNKLDFNEVLSCFEDSLKCVGNNEHLKLWRAYIEYVARQENMDMKLNTIFLQAREQLAFSTEQLTKLLKMEADMKVKTDYDEARKIWNEIMQIPQNKTNGMMWVCFTTLEKHCGAKENLRSMYQKAIKNCPEWAEYFADEWLMHEQETNTVANVMKCMVQSRKMLKEIESNNNDNSNNKRGFYQTQISSNENELRVNKKQKNGNQTSSNGKREVFEKPCIKVVQVPTDLDPLITVFISNITAHVREKELKSLFPNAINITVPTDKFGASRCFAYVQFKDQEETNEALKRDREPIDGRPMFISKYHKDRNNRQMTPFKYENKREPKKLFIRGLPLTYEKDAIENIFKEFKPVDVRVVTKFNGKSKGLAYVEFPSEEDAKRALLATDNKEIEGFTISVAISSPPSKQKGVSIRPDTPTVKLNPKAKLQFLPRCLETKSNVDNTIASNSGGGKSNKDFQDMFKKPS